MTSNSNVFNISGASVAGVNKEHNQDAYGFKESNKYVLIIVADGVGSAKQSRIGSHQAVLAVKRSVVQWRRLREGEVNVLLQLIHFNWNLLINDLQYDKKECLSTCLFVYIDKEEQYVLSAMLGDGMIFINLKGVDNIRLSNGLDFNYTKALGSSKSSKDWQIDKVKIDQTIIKILLATDGISEDIVENKEEDFLNYLVANIEEIETKKRYFKLREIIKDWPAKFHNDDKTVCVLWSKQ